MTLPSDNIIASLTEGRLVGAFPCMAAFRATLFSLQVYIRILYTNIIPHLSPARESIESSTCLIQPTGFKQYTSHGPYHRPAHRPAK